MPVGQKGNKLAVDFWLHSHVCEKKFKQATMADVMNVDENSMGVCVDNASVIWC